MRNVIRKERLRILAVLLAFIWVCKAFLPFFGQTAFDSRAAKFEGKNIWSGKAETMFGHSRNYLYRWSDGYQMTFCISPGKHMGTSVTSEARRTTVDDADIPFIRSTEEYELLADICCWFDRHGSNRADNATYAAVQTAVWAVMNDGWESAGNLEQIIDQHVPGTMKRWEELRNYVERTESAIADMPEWLKTSRRDAQKAPQTMRREAEGWKLELDISAAPVLAASVWQFGDDAEGWSSQVSEGKLIFMYTGSQVPAAVISTPVPGGLMKWHHNTETLNLYLPKDGGKRDQAMISGGVPPSLFYIGLSGDETAVSPEESPEEDPDDVEEIVLPVIYEHRETFTAHYQTGLKKLCAETGKPLQGAEFRVLEAFDAGQTAPLDTKRMTPKPAIWENYKICGEAVTDEDGQFIHRDVKKFEYVKTYCDGHPGMEYLEEGGGRPEPDGEGAGDEEKAQARAEQDSVKARQEALVELCRNYNSGNHFHDIRPGEARRKMLEDRDSTYEKFIGLEYRYAFEETQARYGYVLHGQHPDDEEIPVLCVPSLESGRDAYKDGDFRDVIVNESVGCGDSWQDGGENRKQKWPAASARETAERAAPAASDGSVTAEAGVTDTATEAEIGTAEAGVRTAEDGMRTSEAGYTDAIGATKEATAVGTATAADARMRMAETGFTDDMGAADAATAADALPSENLRYYFTSGALSQRLGHTIPDGPVTDGMEDIALPEPIPDAIEPLPPRSYREDLNENSKVYVRDHRTEGEIHFNKKDAGLAEGEGDGYDSYGDSQGDATLEGAVYGLYAAEDINHPDGKTGVVYRAGELTAVAATDKNGDASFMAYTEEGHIPSAASEEGYAPPTASAEGHASPAASKEGHAPPAASAEGHASPAASAEGHAPPAASAEEYAPPAPSEEKKTASGMPAAETGRQEAGLQETGRQGAGRQETDLYETGGQDEEQGSAIRPRTWIGRPLIAGRYQVREIARSEGYELTADPAAETDRNPAARAEVISAMRHPIDMHDGSWLEFEVSCENTSKGIDLLVSGFPEGSSFYLSHMEETSAGGEVVVDVRMVPTGEYERAEKGEYRLDENGSYVPKRDGQGNILYNLSDPVMKTYFVKRRIDEYPGGAYEITVDPGKWTDRQTVDEEYVRDETNAILAQLGYVVPDSDRAEKAPWSVIELSGQSNQELAEGILEWFAQHSFWSMAVVEKIWKENGRWKALALHDYPGGSAVYEERTGLLYVKIPVRTAIGERHMYVSFSAGNYTFRNGYATVTSLKQAEGEIPEGAVMEDYLETEYHPLYEQYEEGEYRLDGNGERIPVYREEYIMGPSTDTTSEYRLEALEADYDPYSGSYRIHVANTIDWEREKEPVILTFRAVAPGPSPPGRPDLFYSDYLTGVTGAGASAFPCTCGGRPDGLAELVYPGQISPMQDGAGSPGKGTRLAPVSVRETIIRQRVKVFKTLRPAGPPDAAAAGEQEKLPNFRFKAYLKSNLERIYRDENGQIVWLDRKGREIDIAEAKKAYPAPVPAIFTKVPRQTEKLYKQTAEAVNANEVLHPDDGGEPRYDYTAVLETTERELADGKGVRTVKVPNYEKFFDAIAVANYDKWDNGKEQHTSHRPPGNRVNRSEAAEANAEVSDRVRQFAIDWYLDGEAALMDPSGESDYGDRFYDEALQRAVQKADQYLLPFFRYDLDEIYAVAWDGEAGGGADGNAATVSADQEEKEAYVGISSALPYGTYVIVEQQPRYAGLPDLPNRHYRIDSPKEVVVPSVYMQMEGEASDDSMSAEYIYDSGMRMDKMESQYGIRFGVENKEPSPDMAKASPDAAEPYVTEARNHSGDFQIYPYGMDLGRIRNGPGTGAGEGDYFALTQDKWKPFLNYYNKMDDRKASGETSYYLSEGRSGRAEIGKVYRYSSVTESAGTADGVWFAGGTATKENPEGRYFKDGVKTMLGVQTAYEGLYAPMLVPHSPEGEAAGKAETKKEGMERDETGDGSCARVRFTDRPYRTKLRIEKMDQETGENLLHDDAIFHIYTAERDKTPDGEGRVAFYDEDTPVRTWQKQFLEDMRASSIRRLPDGRYEGVIPAGTPVCAVSRLPDCAADARISRLPVCADVTRVFQTDTEGVRTGVFHAYTTSRDGLLEGAGEDFTGGFGQQNAGWLETPEPLNAGAYVLAEVKAPAGYVRSRPVAVEVYSDAVTYYRKGSKDDRVAATVYASGEGEQKEREDSARIYVENAPTRLRVEKRKEAWAGMEGTMPHTVTYRLSGRIDGSLAEIGGNADYEYAFRNGVYMGYAWKKGTLEYLKALKDAGMDVRIVYHGELFAGYGYITQPMETADDGNRYVSGALMTLYEGLELIPSGRGQDLAYDGLVVERRETGNVKRMYVKNGYAGFRTEFRKGTETDPLTGADVWSAEKTAREDTDILFYDMGGLELFRTRTIAGREVRYAYGRNHEMLEVSQLEEDKEAAPATDGSQSIFAFRGDKAVFELAGGNFMKISYSAADKVMEGEFARPEKRLDGSVRMSGGVTLYHMDEDGNRDSLADPYTGMAYALAEGGDGAETVRVLVWPVVITRDDAGHLLAQEKVATSRIATVGGDADAEYLTGTWRPENGEQSHGMFSLTVNRPGQNRNGEPVLTGNTGELEKSMRPVYDRHGLVQYYRNSGERYETDTALYDRTGRKVRDKTSALAGEYDEASYVMREDRGETDAPDKKSGTILHRAGESYILENTWVTGEISPDDPFSNRLTDGQADMLRRVPVGTYIMEELAAPEGYLKGFPAGVIVEETAEIQKASMTDRTTKVLVGKADGTSDYTYKVLDMQKLDRLWQEADNEQTDHFRQETDAQRLARLSRQATLGTVTEGKGAFSQKQISGARLALYRKPEAYPEDGHSDAEEDPAAEEAPAAEEKPVAEKDSDAEENSGAEEDPAAKEKPVAEKDPDVEEDSDAEENSGAEDAPVAEWVSGEEPFYMEGIPVGDYLLKELEAPPGMVSAPPLEVTVGKTGQVQAYILYDDHTKVEIEKYTGNKAERRLLNGAGFTVYGAVTDEQGRVVCDEDGRPEYDPRKVVDHFVSDDGERYIGFIRGFEEQFERYGTKFRAVSWEQDGQIHTASYVSHTQIDASAGGGRENTFPTTIQMLLRTEDGAEIRVTAYGQGESRLGSNWVYEYRFDYHALPGVNDRASSYLTEGGMRRFDYLPPGAVYVAVETEPPAGYAAADPVLLRVRDLADVQRYRICDEEGELLISKTFSDGDGRELPGARLALYRAAPGGGLVREENYLAAVWVSGQDGIYTENDWLAGQIPQGYRIGDRRPHRLRWLPEGDYWLVELESPGYYTTFEPVKITYHESDPVRVVRVSDVPAEGRLTVRKTDTDGGSLTGAVFELSAYRQPDLTNPIFTREFSDSDGTAVLSGLPVGEVQKDGSIIPYCYRLKEIVPPEGYAVNPRIWSFEFAPDREGVSYAWGEAAGYEQQITDKKTRITIRKKDFDEAYVAGAELAVYLVEGTDETGRYLFDTDAPVDRWITSETETEHVLEGLMAGRSYLLAELSVPEGYQLMEPVVFTISADGRRIGSIGSQAAAITLRDLYSATIRGRYAIKSEITVTDQAGERVASWTASGGGHRLTAADGIRDGEVYTLTEKTVYSDGTGEITGRQTRRFYLTDGVCLAEDRKPQRVHLSLRELDESADGEGAKEPAPYEAEGKGTERTGDACGKEPAPYEPEGEETERTGDACRKEPASYEPEEKGTELTGDARGKELASYEPEEKQPELTVGDPGSEQELFSTHKSYVLIETTWFSDGSSFASGRLAFRVGGDGSVEAVAGYDKERRTVVSKLDAASQEELPGARLQILDGEGGLIEEWVSNGLPHILETPLTPGRRYRLRESAPPDGYAWADEIGFAVLDGGSEDQIVMEDRPTHVSVTKTDMAGEKGLAGAKMQILELPEQTGRPEGESGDPLAGARLVEEWISTGEEHEIVGVLKAGRTYILHEETAPPGYACAEDILFTVSGDGRIDELIMKDVKLPDHPDKPHEPGKPWKPEEPVRPEEPVNPEEPPVQAEKPEAAAKIPGTVEAEYRVRLFGAADIPFGSLRYVSVPETGDGNVGPGLAVLLMAGSAVVCLFLGRRMRGEERNR